MFCGIYWICCCGVTAMIWLVLIILFPLYYLIEDIWVFWLLFWKVFIIGFWVEVYIRVELIITVWDGVSVLVSWDWGVISMGWFGWERVVWGEETLLFTILDWINKLFLFSLILEGVFKLIFCNGTDENGELVVVVVVVVVVDLLIVDCF